MNLKKYKREVEIVETDIPFPVYLHYQDEDCNDTLIKINDKYKITVQHGNNDFILKVDYSRDGFPLEEGFENSLSTEELFNEFYNEAMEDIKNVVDGIPL